MLTSLLLTIAAYLLGSLSSAILVSRAMGLPDPRGEGSGNPGATNVLRYGGRVAGGMTLLGDGAKGTLPVLAGVLLGIPDAGLAAVGLAAFLGHVFPVFFGFQGGKGIATGLGVLLGWSWLTFLAAVATWLVVAAIARMSSLAALVAFLLAPVYIYAFQATPWISAAAIAMTAATYWRHTGNIRRILAGTEPKLGRSRS
jgi:glycerol-3-phosphate acyltransferase PlsY